MVYDAIWLSPNPTAEAQHTHVSRLTKSRPPRVSKPRWTDRSGVYRTRGLPICKHHHTKLLSEIIERKIHGISDILTEIMMGIWEAIRRQGKTYLSFQLLSKVCKIIGGACEVWVHVWLKGGVAQDIGQSSMSTHFGDGKIHDKAQVHPSNDVGPWHSK